MILALGDRTVRRSEFERHLKALEAREGSALAPAVRAALLDPFLEERVLVLEARRRGMVQADATPELEAQAVRRLLAEAALARVAVSDEELAAYFREHGEKSRVPETVTLRQILVPSEAEARDVRRRVVSDPRSFDLLARSRSRAPEASTGGVMGTFARGQLPPELEAVAFALAPARTSDVIATGLGYHVLRVDAHAAPRERTLDECRAEIRALLLREKSDLAVRTFVSGLLARAKVNHEAAQAADRPS